MMEEQNQEKATATQHVKAADAAAPETGNGKKEDKGGGKKEKKTAKPLTPKQLQQRKKLMVYPLMGLLFLGSMWLIFAPSEKREVNRDTVGAFNADIPLPENDGIDHVRSRNVHRLGHLVTSAVGFQPVEVRRNVVVVAPRGDPQVAVGVGFDAAEVDRSP